MKSVGIGIALFHAEQIVELGLYTAGLGIRLVEVSLGITEVDFPDSLGEFIQALISQ